MTYIIMPDYELFLISRKSDWFNKDFFSRWRESSNWLHSCKGLVLINVYLMIWFSRLTGTITTLSTAAFLTSDLLAASIQTSVVARVDPSEWSFFESTFLDENCEVGEWEEALRNFLSFAFVRTMCKTYDQLARDGWLDDVVNDEGIILDELFSKALWASAPVSYTHLTLPTRS